MEPIEINRASEITITSLYPEHGTSDNNIRNRFALLQELVSGEEKQPL
jgi:hypothetical protein